jgi:hypothetical protein
VARPASFSRFTVPQKRLSNLSSRLSFSMRYSLRRLPSAGQGQAQITRYSTADGFVWVKLPAPHHVLTADRCRLRQQLRDHLAMNVREPEVAALEAIG